MAAGIAAHNAAVPAPNYISALGTLASARSFLVALGRTFRDAAMDGDPCAGSPTQLTTRATQMTATTAPLRAEARKAIMCDICVDAQLA